MFEETLQFLQGARHAHARGVFVAAQGLADRAEIILFKKAKEDGGAIRLVQFVDGFIQHRRDK